MKRADSVTVSVFVEADPALAFEVFTRDVDLWWKRGIAFRVAGNRPSTMRFEPGEGGRLIESFEDDARPDYVVGRVLNWKPGERLTFEFRGPNFTPEQCTEVDVQFAGEPGGTRVTLAHGGWSSLPFDHPVRHAEPDDVFYGRWGSLWRDQLISLRVCGQLRAAQSEAKPE